MKKILLLLVVSLIFASCSDDDDGIIEITNIKVNHFKDTGYVTFASNLGLTISIQEGNQIGQEQFTPLLDGINGFEYELGFIYNLKVSKTRLVNPPQDASSIRIDLLEVISKTAVSTDTEFKVRLTLKRTDDIFDNWVFSDQQNNYSIMNSSIRIDCESLCEELSTKINNQEQLTGVFIHGEGDQYILQELLNE